MNFADCIRIPRMSTYMFKLKTRRVDAIHETGNGRFCMWWVFFIVHMLCWSVIDNNEKSIVPLSSQMAEAINLVEFSCDGRLCISYSDLDVNVDAKHCQWDNVLKLVTEAHRSRAFLASPLRNLTTKLLWKWIHHESDVLGNYSLHLSLNLRTTNLTESGRIK